MEAQPVAPPPICILGLSRSGTSLTTRVIGLLGVDLGPEDRMWPVVEDNPTGYWEQTAIIELNDAILTRFDGTWWEPPELPDGWEREDSLNPLKERAERLIAEHFQSGRRWGWKDPRTCLTLPFWREVVGDMVFVLCFRNPVDVVESLHEQSRFYHQRERSLALWLRFGATILRATRGQRRLVVFYEDWFDRTDEQLQRLAKFVLEGAEGPVGWEERARGFMDAGLRHQRTATGEVAANRDVPLEARLFDRVLRERVAADGSRDIETLLPELDDALRARMKASRDLREARELVAGKDEELGSMRSELDLQVRRTRELQAAVEQHRGSLQGVQSSLSWRITSPLRAAKRALMSAWRSRRGGVPSERINRR